MTRNTTKCWSISVWPPFLKASLSGEQVLELSVDPPDPAKIPNESDLLGVTVLMLTALYRRQEFFRCSYFIYNNYEDESLVEEGELQPENITRSILVDKPRLRVYEIIWDYASTVRMVSESLGKGSKRRGCGGKRISKRKKEGGV